MKCAISITVVLASLTAAAGAARANDFGSVLRALGRAAEQVVQDQQRQSGTQNSQAGEPGVTHGGERDGSKAVTSLGGGFNRVGHSIDTPENLQLLTEKVAGRIKGMHASANEVELMMACREEMRLLARYESIMGSGFDELKQKCEVEQRVFIGEFHARREQLILERREAEAKARSERDLAEKRTEEQELQVLTAELRSGRRQPVNCAQWMIVKGQDLKSLNAKVTEVSFQPPSGIGAFAGRVEQIGAGTLLLSDQPVIRLRHQPQGYYVVQIGSQAKIFDGENIKLGTVVAGFATQSAVRSLKMRDGAVSQAPVLQVTCAQAVF